MPLNDVSDGGSMEDLPKINFRSRSERMEEKRWKRKNRKKDHRRHRRESKDTAYHSTVDEIPRIPPLPDLYSVLPDMCSSEAKTKSCRTNRTPGKRKRLSNEALKSQSNAILGELFSVYTDENCRVIEPKQKAKDSVKRVNFGEFGPVSCSDETPRKIKSGGNECSILLDKQFCDKVASGRFSVREEVNRNKLFSECKIILKKLDLEDLKSRHFLDILPNYEKTCVNSEFVAKKYERSKAKELSTDHVIESEIEIDVSEKPMYILDDAYSDISVEDQFKQDNLEIVCKDYVRDSTESYCTLYRTLSDDGIDSLGLKESIRSPSGSENNCEPWNGEGKQHCRVIPILDRYQSMVNQTCAKPEVKESTLNLKVDIEEDSINTKVDTEGDLLDMTAYEDSKIDHSMFTLMRESSLDCVCDIGDNQKLSNAPPEIKESTVNLKVDTEEDSIDMKVDTKGDLLDITAYEDSKIDHSMFTLMREESIDCVCDIDDNQNLSIAQPEIKESAADFKVDTGENSINMKIDTEEDSLDMTACEDSKIDHSVFTLMREGSLDNCVCDTHNSVENAVMAADAVDSADCDIEDNQKLSITQPEIQSSTLHSSASASPSYCEGPSSPDIICSPPIEVPPILQNVELPCTSSLSENRCPSPSMPCLLSMGYECDTSPDDLNNMPILVPEVKIDLKAGRKRRRVRCTRVTTPLHNAIDSRECNDKYGETMFQPNAKRQKLIHSNVDMQLSTHIRDFLQVQEIQTNLIPLPEVCMNMILCCEEDDGLDLGYCLNLIEHFSMKNVIPGNILKLVIKSAFFCKNAKFEHIHSTFKLLSQMNYRQPGQMKVKWNYIEESLKVMLVDGQATSKQFLQSSLLLKLLTSALQAELYSCDLLDTELRRMQAFHMLSTSNRKCLVGYIGQAICSRRNGGHAAVLTNIQDLLSLCVDVSSSCVDCAESLAQDLMVVYRRLPDLASKRALLESFTCDLLRFKLVQMVLECGYSATQYFSGFPDSLRQVTIYFKAVPRASSVTPTAIPYHDHMQPVAMERCPASEVEETAMLLFFIVKSYLHVSKAQTYLSLRKRTVYASKGIRTWDHEEMRLLSEQVPRLEEHLRRLCPDLTVDTQQYLLLLSILGDTGL